jgi:hypothetical protein
VHASDLVSLHHLSLRVPKPPILPTYLPSSFYQQVPKNLPPPLLIYPKVKETETHKKLHIMATLTRQAMHEFHRLYLLVIAKLRTWCDSESVGALSDELNRMLRISFAFLSSKTPASDPRLSLLTLS